MKKLKEEKHNDEKIVSIWFQESAIDRVDRLAVRGDISRSKLVRNLTMIGVEYLETCEKFGLMQTALVLRDFAAWFKEKCERGIDGHVKKA